MQAGLAGHCISYRWSLLLTSSRRASILIGVPLESHVHIEGKGFKSVPIGGATLVLLTPHDAQGSAANKLQGSFWVTSQKVSEPLNLQAATSGQFGDEPVAACGRQLSPIPLGRGRGHMFPFRMRSSFFFAWGRQCVPQGW